MTLTETLTGKVNLYCPTCRKDNLTSAGYAWSYGERVRRYRCESCGKITIYPLHKCVKLVTNVASE